MSIIRIKGILFGLFLSLSAISVAEAYVCFLPDPSACDTGNMSGEGGFSIGGYTETCGSQYNRINPVAGMNCTRCTDPESIYYGRYYCICPEGQRQVGDKCVCIDGYLDSTGECVPCVSPKVWNSTTKTCECPDDMIEDCDTCKPCPDGKIAENNKCVCPAGSHEAADGTCITCGDKKVWNEAQGKCVCDSMYVTDSDGNCVLRDLSPEGCTPPKIYDVSLSTCVCPKSCEGDIDPVTCECIEPEPDNLKCSPYPNCENPNETWYLSYPKYDESGSAIFDEAGNQLFGGCMICNDTQHLIMNETGCACKCTNGFEPEYLGKKSGDTWLDDWFGNYELAYYDNKGNRCDHLVEFNSEDCSKAWDGDYDPNPFHCYCPSPREDIGGKCECPEGTYNKDTNTCDTDDPDGGDEGVYIIVKAECFDESDNKISCNGAIEDNSLKIQVSNLKEIVMNDEMTFNSERSSWKKYIPTTTSQYFNDFQDDDFSSYKTNGMFHIFGYTQNGTYLDKGNSKPWTLAITAENKTEISVLNKLYDSDGMIDYYTGVNRGKWDSSKHTLTYSIKLKKSGTPVSPSQEKEYRLYAIGYCKSPFQPVGGEIPCSATDFAAGSFPDYIASAFNSGEPKWGSSATDALCPIRIAYISPAVMLNKPWDYADRFYSVDDGEEKRRCASEVYIQTAEGAIVPDQTITQSEIDSGYERITTAKGLPLSIEDITGGKKELDRDETLMVFNLSAEQVRSSGLYLKVVPVNNPKYMDVEDTYPKTGFEYTFVKNNTEEGITYDKQSIIIKSGGKEFDDNFIGTDDNRRYLNNITGKNTDTNILRLYPVIRLRFVDSETPSSYVSYFRRLTCPQCFEYCSMVDSRVEKEQCMVHDDTNTQPLSYITATRNVLSDISLPQVDVSLSWKKIDDSNRNFTDADCEAPCREYLNTPYAAPHFNTVMKKGDALTYLIEPLPKGGTVEVNRECGQGNLGACIPTKGVCSCSYSANIRDVENGKIKIPEGMDNNKLYRDGAVYIFDEYSFRK